MPEHTNHESGEASQPRVLRFGIPSLDELVLPDAYGKEGKTILRRCWPPLEATSVCIVGPNGAGKSVFALHLASRYRADCLADQKRPHILYVSTDLQYGKAKQTWSNFRLGDPPGRTIPFEPTGYRSRRRLQHPITLERISLANEQDKLSDMLRRRNSTSVGFVDIASTTAGDEWGFINRLLATLPGSSTNIPLVVIDAIEGFETLVGEHDAYGLERTRRSRIAQIMRSAGNRCHVVFVTEDDGSGGVRAEQFVSDIVLRLHAPAIRGYTRRTVTIEKTRGHNHVRGHHVFTIRSGGGSTTHDDENPDDPVVPKGAAENEPNQSYVQVFHSLQYISRRFMKLEGKPPLSNRSRKGYASFGIKHLDNMLGEGLNGRGIPVGETTALIGESGTQRTPLGMAFLSEGLRPYAERLLDECERERWTPESPHDEVMKTGDVAVFIGTKIGESWGFYENLIRLQFGASLSLRETQLEWIRNGLAKRIVRRRLEIHDVSSAIMFHIFRSVIEKAIRQSDDTPEKVRVVIDDFRTIRETYPEVVEDKLFLPYLLQYLADSRVTALLIDTQPGRPNELYRRA